MERKRLNNALESKTEGSVNVGWVDPLLKAVGIEVMCV